MSDTDRVTAPRLLPLDKLEVMAGCTAGGEPDGHVSLRIPPDPGHYGLASPNLKDWVGEQQLEIPSVVRLSLKVDAGCIGVVFATSDLRRFITHEICADAATDEHVIELYVDDISAGARLLVRNFGCADVSPSGIITSVSYIPAWQLSRGHLKFIRARAFTTWYYTADLGDGLIKRATFDNEAEGMRYMTLNRAIMLWLMQRQFGSLEGRRIVDTACSGGFHSFGLAQAGAAVVAFDREVQAIWQAKFIQDCIGSDFSHKIEFLVDDFYAFADREAPFDLIYCSGLFYHLADPLGAAQRLYALCKVGAVIQSSVAPRDDCVFELSDSEKYSFGTPTELALVPSATMLKRLFERVNFRNVELYRQCEFRNTSEGVLYNPALPFEAGAPAYVVCVK